MKKITIVVPDAMVGAIVELVASEVTELHIETVGTAPDVKRRGQPHKRQNANGRTTDEAVLGLLPATMEGLRDGLQAAGFGRSTAYGVVARLVGAGKVETPTPGSLVYRRK